MQKIDFLRVALIPILFMFLMSSAYAEYENISEELRGISLPDFIGKKTLLTFFSGDFFPIEHKKELTINGESLIIYLEELEDRIIDVGTQTASFFVPHGAFAELGTVSFVYDGKQKTNLNIVSTSQRLAEEIAGSGKAPKTQISYYFPVALAELEPEGFFKIDGTFKVSGKVETDSDAGVFFQSIFLTRRDKSYWGNIYGKDEPALLGLVTSAAQPISYQLRDIKITKINDFEVELSYKATQSNDYSGAERDIKVRVPQDPRNPFEGVVVFGSITAGNAWTLGDRPKAQATLEYDLRGAEKRRQNIDVQPPIPKPRGIVAFFSQIRDFILGVFKRVGIFTIAGNIEVAPNTQETYDLSLSLDTPIDSDFSDGTIEYRYAQYAVIDKNENVLFASTPELIQNSYAKKATITTPAKIDEQVLGAFITSTRGTFDTTTKAWYCESADTRTKIPLTQEANCYEEVIKQEAIILKNKVRIAPETPKPKGILAFFKSISDFIKKLFGR